MPKRKKIHKTTPPSSLKGMRDIMGEEYFDYQGIFEKASEVAIYYGFHPIETPVLEKIDVFTRAVGEGTDLIDKELYSLRTKSGDNIALRPEGTAPILRAYIEHGMRSRPQPVMFYNYGPFFRHERPQHGRLRELRQFGLEILGTEKSIADATVIKAMVVILEELGFKNTVVHINNIGNNKCKPDFLKKLVTYYKKHINNLCPHCQKRIKTNPMRLLDCKDTRCAEFKHEAPTPIDCLCCECRKHFKEVLEYLEALNIRYEIKHHLVRGLDYYTKTVFEIFDEREIIKDENTEVETKTNNKSKKKTPPSALAGGGRYDCLASAIGNNSDIPSVGGSIGIDRVVLSGKYKHISPRIVKKPKVYLIQIGFDAKLKSLSIVEMLRKAKIPVEQSLSKDGLGAQLGHAEKLKIPYIIIFGQKEAIEDTVIIRNMKTRSQETIPMKDLTSRLKKLK